MYRYEIKALYKPTNKRRTIRIEARNREDALAHIKLNPDYVEPFEVDEFFDPPTERQLEYAKDLRVKIPKGVSMRDASALIDWAVNHDSDPGADLVEYARSKGIIFSDYIGKKALYNLIFDYLPQLDKTAFFAFSLYRWLSEDRRGNLDTHPQRQLFYDYGQLKANDEKFTKSIDDNYRGEDIRFFGMIKFADGGEATGGSTSTFAYKDCANYLNEKFGLKKTKTKTFADDACKPLRANKPAKKDEPVSKTAMVIVGIFFVVIVWYAIKFLWWLFS